MQRRLCGERERKQTREIIEMGNCLICCKSQGATENPVSNMDSDPSSNPGTRPSTFTTPTGESVFVFLDIFLLEFHFHSLYYA